MKNLKFKTILVSLLLALSLSAGACTAITTTPMTQETTPNQTTEQQTQNEPTVTFQPDTSAPKTVLPGLADMIARVKPSVVAINTEVTTSSFGSSFTQQESVGTGWIIDEAGYIVTNDHVASAAAPNIIVILDDGRALRADIVGADPLSDLAVLKITADNLPAVTVGDSSAMRIGDWVVAIGNSLGEGIRATQGIISRENVSIDVEGNQLFGLIETDAAINPGNSGGPLVNLAGEVIGITNAKLTSFGVEATGYAISLESALPVINQLTNKGEVVYPWLGVSLYTVDQFAIMQFDLAVEEGALIITLVDGSPADNAGLREEDVITMFNGIAITSVDDLVQAIRSSSVGQTVDVEYVRGGQTLTTQATLVQRPPMP